MFEKLPIEIQEYIFSFLSALERMRVARVNKSLNKRANAEQFWKLDCQKANIPVKEGDDYKAFFKKNFFLKKNYILTDSQTVYYMVGNAICLTDKWGVTREDNIHNDEIINSFTLVMKIKVFRTLEEANDFVNGIESYQGMSSFQLTGYVIFAVNLKSSIKAHLDYNSHRKKPFFRTS